MGRKLEKYISEMESKIDYYTNSHARSAPDPEFGRDAEVLLKMVKILKDQRNKFRHNAIEVDERSELWSRLDSIVESLIPEREGDE